MLSQEQEERLARNEAFFRGVNEEIQAVGLRLATSPVDEYEFFCECPDPDCTEQVRLSIAAYEAVRASPRRFIVAPGHDVPEIERVVAIAEGVSVVEKDGPAGEIVAELDPRG